MRSFPARSYVNVFQKNLVASILRAGVSPRADLVKEAGHGAGHPLQLVNALAANWQHPEYFGPIGVNELNRDSFIMHVLEAFACVSLVPAVFPDTNLTSIVERLRQDCMAGWKREQYHSIKFRLARERSDCLHRPAPNWHCRIQVSTYVRIWTKTKAY